MAKTKAAEKRRQQPGPEAMVAVRVPEPMRQRAKVLASQTRRDLQDVLAEILDEGLKKRNA